MLNPFESNASMVHKTGLYGITEQNTAVEIFNSCV